MSHGLLLVNMNVYLALFVFALTDHVMAAMPKFVFAHFIVSGIFAFMKVIS